MPLTIQQIINVEIKTCFTILLHSPTLEATCVPNSLQIQFFTLKVFLCLNYNKIKLKSL